MLLGAYAGAICLRYFCLFSELVAIWGRCRCSFRIPVRAGLDKHVLKVHLALKGSVDFEDYF